MMNRATFGLLAAGAALAGFAMPAQAATCINPNSFDAASTGEDSFTTDIGSPGDVVACIGKYNYGTGNGNNLLNNSAGNPEKVEDALSRLGLAIDADASYWASPKKVSTALASGATLTFSEMLVGDTFIGIHWGGNRGTTFYKLHFDTPTAGVVLNRGNFSGGVLFATGITAVPEPASWAMLIAGMGAVGVAMRRRKVNVSFA